MKTLSIGTIFGLFGAVAVSVSFAAQWPTWVMFIAWVSFYIFGKTIKTSLLAFLQIALGFLMGILIQTCGTFLAGYIAELGLAVAVFFFIGSLPYITKIKMLNNIPAVFLGLIIFFGVHPKIAPMPIFELSIPIIAGFIFAALNDWAVQSVMKKQVA
ncbi:MAG: hypothetical protein JWR38_5491 [Mucilaginibacter sp.]|nr:hypothetical protein [Mucilaginibacter sp.]